MAETIDFRHLYLTDDPTVFMSLQGHIFQRLVGNGRKTQAALRLKYKSSWSDCHVSVG